MEKVLFVAICKKEVCFFLLHQNGLLATVATLLRSNTYAASIAMLAAASSWSFFAVNEKLVSFIHIHPK